MSRCYGQLKSLGITLGLFVQTLPCFALTFNLPVVGTFGAIPTISVNPSPNFGTVEVASATNTVDLYTNGTCNAVTGTLCRGGAPMPVAGVVTIMTDSAAGNATLSSVSLDANSYSIGSGTLTLGAGSSGASVGTALGTTAVNFPLGGCSSTLAPNSFCTFNIGGRITNLTTTANTYTSSTITLTLNYS